MARDGVVLDASGRPVGVRREEQDGTVSVIEKTVFQEMSFAERYAVSRAIVEQKRAHPDLAVKDENMEAACDLVLRVHNKYGDSDIDRLLAQGYAGLVERKLMTVHRVQNGLADVTLDLTLLCTLDIVPGTPLS